MNWNESGPDRHPPSEVLLSRADGALDAEPARRVDAHLEACALCRLALKQARRFDELDDDEEAAAAAQWERMAPRLDAAWRAEGRPRVLRPRRRAPGWLWPVAAAAVLALLAINVGERGIRSPGVSGRDTVRGTPAVAASLTELAPQGELPQPPRRFDWSSEREFAAFDLEVFTGDLEPVLQLDGIAAPPVELPDSLRTLLQSGQTYFWHVRGRVGLDAAEVSPTVWFRIGPAPAE